MKSFLEWLEESQFKFIKGRDQDYTGDPAEVLVFSEHEPEDYQVRGKTHGQMSHAIKHLVEFDPDYVKTVLSNTRKMIKTFLQRRPQYFCKIWNETRGFSEYSGIEALEHCKELSLLNTFDIINDKNQNKSPFTKIDGQIKKFALELEKRYNELIDKKIDKAIDIDNLSESDCINAIKKNPVIKFEAFSKFNKIMTIWLDFRDQSIIIGDKSKGGEQNVRSMYRFDKIAGGNKKAVIKQMYTKHLTPVSKVVNSAMSNI